MDGDGDLDFLACSLNRVQVSTNDGTGVFTPSATYTLANPAQALRLADVDGDGDLDLLVNVTPNRSAVLVMRNNGSGSFANAGTFGAFQGVYIPNLAVGDIDGDGDLDLAVPSDGNVGNTNITLLTNNGQGLFTQAGIATAYSAPVDVALGDLDNDGDLDMAVSNHFGDHVSIRFNDGTGVFSGGSEVLVTSGLYSYQQPYGVALGDIDGDGDLDLVTTLNVGYKLNVQFNDGQGNFSRSTTLSAGTYPKDVELSDIDGDGDLDAVVANSYSNTTTASLLFNDGQGTFTPGPEVSMGGNPGVIQVGDLDGDGDMDLAGANFNAGTVSIRLNQWQQPVLRAAVPASGSPGTTVTLTGSNLSGITALRFNGVPATSYRVLSPNTVTAVVPAGATTGAVEVLTPGGVTTPSVVFAVSALSTTARRHQVAQVWPNPVVSGATVMVALPWGARLVTLRTILGQVISQQPCTQSQTQFALSTRNLTPGAYVLSVQGTDDGPVTCRLLVH